MYLSSLKQIEIFLDYVRHQLDYVRHQLDYVRHQLDYVHHQVVSFRPHSRTHSKFFLLLLIAIYSSASLAQTNQFTGTFSLPNTQVAPAGGTVYELRTNPLDEFTFNFRVAYSSTQIVIPAGQSSIAYALRLDNSPVVTNKTLEFECVSGCSNLDATTTGWWNATQGVVGLADATIYPANSNRQINLSMQSADTFAGAILFPEEFAATGSEELTIEVKESSFSVTARFTQVVQPSAGATSISFKLGVPAAQTGGGWNMNVVCNACDAELAAGPYYPKSITAEPAALETTGQFFFLKNRDYSNLKFDLISLRQPEVEKVPIAGAISLLLLSD